jgi:hypothetical protein
MNRCHPRLPVTFTIHFLEDCTWSAVVEGRAAIVPDEGVYASAPTVPCASEIPADHRDCQRSDGWYQGLDLDGHRRTRCTRCWFDYGDHPKWPWRCREHLLEAVVAPGSTRDFFVTVDRRSVLRRMRVDGYDENQSYDAAQTYLRTKFRLRAFGRVGHESPLRYSKDEKGPWACFEVGCVPGVILDPGEQLRVCVENVSREPLLFKGSVSGYERIGGDA